MGLFDVFCKATKVRGLQNSNAYLTVTQRLEFSLLFTDQSLPPPPLPLPALSVHVAGKILQTSALVLLSG